MRVRVRSIVHLCVQVLGVAGARASQCTSVGLCVCPIGAWACPSPRRHGGYCSWRHFMWERAETERGRDSWSADSETCESGPGGQRASGAPRRCVRDSDCRQECRQERKIAAANPAHPRAIRGCVVSCEDTRLPYPYGYALYVFSFTTYSTLGFRLVYLMMII